jgi:ribonuclease PH
VALGLAVHGLAAQGIVPRDTLVTEVAAISLGLVDGNLLLDLCYEEDSAATADFNIVMTGNCRLIEVQGTAEGAPFDRKSLDAMLDLAAEGIDDLLKHQRKTLWEAIESRT